MSKFSDKILKGEVPTSDDWVKHLVEAHAHAPSMTPKAFAAFKTKGGQNSYEILAQKISASHESRILDLGCGDGYLTQYLLPKMGTHGELIGIDMSEAELKIARENYKTAQVSYLLGKAQELPLEDTTIDHILCHMVFMLMVPIEPTISEIGRVLRKGGIFSAVMGNSRNAKPTVWHEILNSVYGTIFSRYPKLKEAVSGDNRVNSEDGLKSLFNLKSGFSAPEIYDFALVVPTTADNAWSLMKDMYFVGMLPEGEKSQIGKALRKLAATLSSVHPSFEFPMRLFSTSKLSNWPL